MQRRAFLGLPAAIVAWPLLARAQPLPVIGFMSGRAHEDSDYLVSAFREGLKEAGYEERRNVAIEFRWARGQYDLLPSQAVELVSRPVALLVGIGGDVSAFAAKRASSTIPIVFGMGGDPVAAGLVESFGRPGGNATGFTLLTNEMEPKRLGLLAELVPGAALIGALVDPNFPPAARHNRSLRRRPEPSIARCISSKPATTPSWTTLSPRCYGNGSALCWSPPPRLSIRAGIGSSASQRKTACPPFTSSATMRSPVAWSAMVRASPSCTGEPARMPAVF